QPSEPGWRALISLQFSLQFSWTSRRLWPWPTDNPKEGWKLRALHHFAGFRASRETRFPALQVQPFQQAEADQADADQINRDDQVKQPRHDQDQDACDQGHDR